MYTINESRIAELKEKHGSVYLIKVDDKQAVFKKPNRQDLSYATAVSSQGKDAVKLAETILRSTFVEGDKEILDNDEYFFGAMPVAMEMFETKQGEIKSYRACGRQAGG